MLQVCIDIAREIIGDRVVTSTATVLPFKNHTFQEQGFGITLPLVPLRISVNEKI